MLPSITIMEVRSIVPGRPMRDAVVNRLFAGFEGKTYKGINTESKFIHEFIRQRDQNARDRAGRQIARNTRRMG